MAYEEYYDLYLLAQKNPNALYYVVMFDIVDSRNLSKTPEEGTKLAYNIIAIMKYVYNKLLEKEKELNRQVVIKDERFCTPWDPKAFLRNDHNCLEPNVIRGDDFEFTVLRGTVTKEEIISWVNECKKILNIEIAFHIGDAYYETNEYKEGNTKLYRGYCFHILTELIKSDGRRNLEEVHKIMRSEFRKSRN